MRTSSESKLNQTTRTVSGHLGADLVGSVATPPERLPALSRRESIYLDLLRGLAATAVVLDHAPTVFTLPHMIRWGHHAVILFFVLSGYVISHVADTRESEPRVFLVARFARLWSVLVPAMILTLLCDSFGRRFGIYPSSYAGLPFDQIALRIGAMLAFLSESWVSIQPLSDGVVWSLCLEFWYYMMFAAAIFMKPGTRRNIVVGLCLIMGGHKAILLLPVWLMGVALQRSKSIRRLPACGNTLLWATSLLAIAFVLSTRFYDAPIDFGRHLTPPWIWKQLAQARVFWFDWIFGLLVAAHLLGARTVVSWLPLERIAAPARWLAGISFAIYLFHEPLLHLWGAFLPSDRGWLAIAMTLGVIALLGPHVERSRVWWRRLIMRVTPSTAGAIW